MLSKLVNQMILYKIEDNRGVYKTTSDPKTAKFTKNGIKSAPRALFLINGKKRYSRFFCV